MLAHLKTPVLVEDGFPYTCIYVKIQNINVQLSIFVLLDFPPKNQFYTYKVKCYLSWLHLKAIFLKLDIPKFYPLLFETVSKKKTCMMGLCVWLQEVDKSFSQHAWHSRVLKHFGQFSSKQNNVFLGLILVVSWLLALIISTAKRCC